jgi:hypothetical protein
VKWLKSGSGFVAALAKGKVGSVIWRDVRGRRPRGPVGGGRLGPGALGRNDRLVLPPRLNGFGYDADALALIVVTGRKGYLVAVGRIRGAFDRQCQVMNLVVAFVVVLRIRAIFARKITLGRVVRFGWRDRIELCSRGIGIEWKLIVGGQESPSRELEVGGLRDFACVLFGTG